MNVDFLIIGQGLAGSLLAWYLIQKKQSVVIVDDASIDSASLAAAGIINPVTGKRLVKSWQVDACLPAAKQCYLTLQQQFRTPIFHSLPVYRLFQNEQDIELWQLRSSENAYADYLGDRLPPQGSSGLENPLGGFLIKGSGYINTALLLQQLREHYAAHNQYIDARFLYYELQIKTAAVEWREIESAFNSVHRSSRRKRPAGPCPSNACGWLNFYWPELSWLYRPAFPMKTESTACPPAPGK